MDEGWVSPPVHHCIVRVVLSTGEKLPALVAPKEVAVDPMKGAATKPRAVPPLPLSVTRRLLPAVQVVTAAPVVASTAERVKPPVVATSLPLWPVFVAQLSMPAGGGVGVGGWVGVGW